MINVENMTEYISVEDTDNDEVPELARKQEIIDRAPFQKLKIKDTRILDTIEGRQKCRLCYKSRKFFCYTCCLPVIDKSHFPQVKVTINIGFDKFAIN